jgi:hypothetical protein
VRLDACRGIDLDGSLDMMLRRMRDAGVKLGPAVRLKRSEARRRLRRISKRMPGAYAVL